MRRSVGHRVARRVLEGAVELVARHLECLPADRVLVVRVDAPRRYAHAVMDRASVARLYPDDPSVLRALDRDMPRGWTTAITIGWDGSMLVSAVRTVEPACNAPGGSA